jgi:DNA polymerase-3 subunit epsilon
VHLDHFQRLAPGADLMWPFRRHAREDADGSARLPPVAVRYAVIDTELTGLDARRDSIVSLGGLRIAEGRIVLSDRFYEEVRPDCDLTASSIVLHGITPEAVRERPGIAAVLAGFSAFCATDILLGHFLEIDLEFLRAAFARASLPPLANPVLDTWPLYDWLSSRAPRDGGPGLPRVQDPRLPALAEALGVPCRGEHNALGDAFVTAQVFQRLLRRLDRWGVTSTDNLLHIGNPRRRVEHRSRNDPPLT